MPPYIRTLHTNFSFFFDRSVFTLRPSLSTKRLHGQISSITSRLWHIPLPHVTSSLMQQLFFLHCLSIFFYVIPTGHKPTLLLVICSFPFERDQTTVFYASVSVYRHHWQNTTVQQCSVAYKKAESSFVLASPFSLILVRCPRFPSSVFCLCQLVSEPSGKKTRAYWPSSAQPATSTAGTRQLYSSTGVHVSQCRL